MTELHLTTLAIAHVVAARLRSTGALGPSDPTLRDRGAVSLEQALWYAAAAVAVAVVAAIIWSQIRSTASTPVDVPSAP